MNCKHQQLKVRDLLDLHKEKVLLVAVIQIIKKNRCFFTRKYQQFCCYKKGVKKRINTLYGT